MTMLVSLVQAKRHLRVTHTADDPDITLKIHAASGAVINYLKSSAYQWVDSSGAVLEDSNGVLVPHEVQEATLVLLGWMFSYREGETGESNPAFQAFEQGYLPPPVIALLYPLRDPALA
jgi:hypothetical protein